LLSDLILELVSVVALTDAVVGVVHLSKSRLSVYASARNIANAQYRFNQQFDLKSMAPRLAAALMRANAC
jgi:hypothetical protein